MKDQGIKSYLFKKEVKESNRENRIYHCKSDNEIIRARNISRDSTSTRGISYRWGDMPIQIQVRKK